jgi:nucleoside-diphosphate-sugar epimerase
MANNTFVLMHDSFVNRCQPLPAGSKLCILGAGFSGSRLASLASALQIPVISTRREPSPDSEHLAFDTATGQAPDRRQLEGITHLLNTIPPDRDGNDPVLKTLGDQIQQWPLRWVGYLSTTGVYGNTDGAWVCEDDPPEPTQDRSRRRLACEQEWQARGLPLQILRLPGIYGPGRSALAAVKAGTLQPVDKPGQMFCRIHVDDVAAACLHLMHRSAQGQHPEIVNVCDDEPAASVSVHRYAASLLNCELPQPKPFTEAEASMSAMARSFWADNRRVSNQRLRQDLGYELIYPTYRSGLAQCLEIETLTESRTPSSPA